MFKLNFLSKNILLSTLCCSQFSFANEQSTDIVVTEKTTTEVIEVIGRAEQFYLAKETKVGSKVNLSLLELPQSAQILTEQLIIDQAARDITDLYRSIAGVSEYSYSGVTFRGFRDDSNVFYDGVRGDPYSGFGVPQLFNVERVEILKGPASALYGGGEPGGMINYVTKKPSFNNEKKLKLTLGNFATQGASLDMTGGLTEDVAYRLGGFYEQQNSFRNNADAQNIELATGILYNISPDTSLTTTVDFIKQDLGGNRLRGVPVDDNGNFLVDPSYNANEKVDYQNMEALVIQAELSHYFTDNFTVNTSLRYLDNKRDQAYHESREWIDANGDGVADINDQIIKREYRKQYRANEEISLTSDFVYEFETSNFEHQFLFGADYHTVDTKYDYLRARYEADGVANLNIFDLNYGITDPNTYSLTDQNRDGVNSDRYGIYVQDVVKINDKWTVIAGLRYDSFEEYNQESDYSYQDSGVTPRLAVTYLANSATSLYVNYSESFNPASSSEQETVAEEGSLTPESGKQVEIGLKKEWFDGKMLSTFAIYKINKENVVMSNPDFTGDNNVVELLNIGEVESNGFETTLIGDLADNWTITANYAYNDTKVIKGISGDTITNSFGDGSRFVNAPRHQAGLWTRYDITDIASSIAFGLNHVSEQISLSDQKVKPFTVFDMSWTTRINDALLSVNVNNLFDKEYAVSGFSERNGHFPGSPRTIIAQLTYNF